MTDSLMGVVQAALRAATGTTQTYQGDWHAYADLQSIASGSWDGRVLALAQAIDPTITTAAAAHEYFLQNPSQISSALYWELPEWPTPSGTTVQVTNDTEFTNALSTLSATGGIIELNPAGTYAARTFSSNPSAMIYIVSASSANKATINRITFSTQAISNITFKWVKFGGATTFTGACITGTTAAPYSDLRLYGCEVGGVPLSSTTYPILLNVASGASFAVGEVVTGGTSGSVGTILAISSNQFLVNVTIVGAGGGATQAAPFVATEALTGSIAGSSTVSSQAQYVLYGAQNKFNSIQIHGCAFSSLNNAIKLTGAGVGGGPVYVCDNTFDLLTEDGVYFSDCSSASVVNVSFNVFTRGIGQSSDIGGPHCDSYQISGSPTTTNILNLETFGNILINGFSRGSYQGIPFHSDLTTAYYTEKAVGNINVTYNNASGTQNFTIDRPRGCYTFGNRMGRYNPGTGTGNIARTYYPSGTGSYDLANSYELGGAGLDSNNNYNLVNTDANYETLYSGTFPLTAATHTEAIAEVKTAFEYKSGGPLSSYRNHVDWTNKKINTTLEPAKFNFVTRANIATSTANVETSEWYKNWKYGTSTISSVGGEYSIADDAAGTGASAFTSSAGTVDYGKWIKVRTNASSSAGTSTNVDLTVSSDTSRFSVVTSSADTFDKVDNNGGSIISSGSLASALTVRKGIIAVRYKRDSHTNNAGVFDDTTTGTRFIFNGTNTFRLWLGGSSRIASISSNPTQFPVGGPYQTTIFSFDVTANSIAEGGVKCINNDGTQISLTSTAWTPAASSITIGTTFPKILSGSVWMDGGIAFLWAHFWDGTGVDPFANIDIADAGFWSKFYSEQIGADGSGPLGYQPHFYYTGTAAEWNAGLANKGSISDTLANTGAGPWI